MKMNPPRWAVALCLAWGVAVFYLMLDPFLSGSYPGMRVAPIRAPVELVGVAAVVVFLFSRPRWIYGLCTLGIAVLMFFEWELTSFGGVSPLILLVHLAGLVGTLGCALGTSSRSLGEPKMLLRAPLITAGVAALLGVWTYWQSFQCRFQPGMKAASPTELAGIWIGSRPHSMEEMRPVRLVIRENGTGTLASTAYGLSRQGGHSFHWIMRGHCLHYAAMITDYWSTGASVPQLSADGRTLTFIGDGVYRVHVFHLSETEIFPMPEKA